MRLILNDKIIELDLNLSYSDRVKFCNNIIAEYSDYFNEYWEDKKRKQGGYAQKVKIALDTLGNYLVNSDAVSERQEEYQILNERQIEFRKQREVSTDGLYQNTNTIKTLNDMSENNIKNQGKINLKKYQKSKTHKFAVIRTKPDLRTNRTIFLENTIYNHKWEIDNSKITYKCGKGKDIIINCFTDEDKDLPYIDSSKEYNFKWCSVDLENNFSYNENKYNIMCSYEYDKILVLEQFGYIYFLDENVKLITCVKKHIKGD